MIARQPARPLPLGCARRPTSRSPLLRALREDASVQRGRRPRGDDQADAADIPDHWLGSADQEGQRASASFWGLMETTSERAALRADDADSWLSRQRATQRVLVPVAAADSPSRPLRLGEIAAVADGPTQAREGYYSRARSPTRSSAIRAPTFVWGGDAWSMLAGAPDENQYSRVRTSKVETLVIGGELDFATPPQAATQGAAPHLPNGHQVVLPGFGHSTTFWSEQPKRGSRLINTFSTAAASTRRSTRTARRLHARGHAGGARQGHRGTMVGLACLVVLSLLVDASPRAQARALRAQVERDAALVYPIVLGLGGWFLGVLVVSRRCRRRARRRRLAVSRSAPIGSRLYFAWVNRDWSGRTKRMGFISRGGRRFAGAWLGLQRDRRASGSLHVDRRCDAVGNLTSALGSTSRGIGRLATASRRRAPRMSWTRVPRPAKSAGTLDSSSPADRHVRRTCVFVGRTKCRRRGMPRPFPASTLRVLLRQLRKDQDK
jgi:hypothetical protein